MSDTTRIKIRATARSGESNLIELTAQIFSKKERLRRAVKVALIGLGVTLGFVFVPIAHFVLVPAALLLTPFIAWLVFKQTQWIPKQSIPCPHCQKEMEWPSASKVQDAQLLCDACRSVVDVAAEGSSS